MTIAVFSDIHGNIYSLEKALKIRFPHFKVFTADFDNVGVRVEI